MGNKRILVTGGCGYVGSVLVDKLIKKNYDVVVLSSKIFSIKRKIDNCTIVYGDLRNIKDINNCFKDDIYAVIHLAAISNDPCGDYDPKLTHDINVKGTENLLEVSKQNKIHRFIYSSTNGVLAPEPLSIYAKTKLEGERLVNSFSKDFTTVCFRSSTVCGYSPNMSVDTVVNIMTTNALLSGKITLYGGDQKRTLIHIDDITDFYISLLELPKEKVEGRTFNCGGEVKTIRMIAENVKKYMPKVIIDIQPSHDDRSFSTESDQLEKELGLSRKKTVDDAILDIIDAYKKGLLSLPLVRKVDILKKSTAL